MLCISSSASAGERTALLVGNARGREDQPLLRHTSKDLRRVRAVFSDLGGMAPADVRELENLNADGLLTALEAQTTRAGPAELFVFYYSGHSDAYALQLGETSLSLERLLKAIRQVPAHLRLVILDACQSGAATRKKGVIVGPPVSVGIDSSLSHGEVLITSSSADEQSYESDQLEGAVFTVHWVSGLRGAADENGDGAVSLSEAYRYAHSRTVHSTLLSASGPQRPAFSWDLEGNREPMLTRLSAKSRLTLSSTSSGRFFVFDADEEHLMAELESVPQKSLRLALPPGQYVVHQRTVKDVRRVKIELSEGDDRVLEDTRMQSAPLVRLARKGGAGRWSAIAGAGQVLSALGPETFLALNAGVELERGATLCGLRAFFLTGNHESAGLSVHQRGVGGFAQVLWGLRLGDATLRLGPSIGVLGISQSVTRQPSRTGFIIFGGVTARVEVAVSSVLSLYATGDVQAWGAQTTSVSYQPPMSVQIGDRAMLLAAGGWNAGVRAAF